MNESVIAIIIIGVTVICYSLEVFPIAMVSILSLVVMVMTGILPFDEAFRGFSSSTIFTVIGMMFIGQSLFENGVARKIGEIAFGSRPRSERFLVAKMFFVTSVLSAFLYNTSVIVMMMPIVSDYVSRSNGRLKRKNFYMALSHGTILGSRMTIIGADGFFMAHEVFQSASIPFRFGFFDPFLIMFVTVTVVTLLYYFVLYPLEVKIFDWQEEIHSDCVLPEKNTCDRKKAGISVLVIVGVSVSAALIRPINQVIPSLNLGVIALLGAAILFLTGCIKFEEQLNKLNLNTVIILGSSYGFAACFIKTGLGERLVELLIQAGDRFHSLIVLILLFSMGSALITNLMSNAAAVTILTSLAVTTGIGLGLDFVPLVMAVVCGTAGGVMLPTSTPTLTLSMEAGYRYRDYILIGGIVFVVSSIVESIMIFLVG